MKSNPLVIVSLVFGCALLTTGNASAQQGELLSLQKAKFGGQSSYKVKETFTEKVETAYQIQVPYTEQTTQEYTIQVPYTENVTQKYTVQVPYTATETDENGKKKEVQKTRTEDRTRTVPVQRLRTETRTRSVPVTKTRTETRTRAVPQTKTRTITKTRKFPPVGATFAYVSGEEITIEQLKEIAAEEIPILSLDAGQSLSEISRAVLKPTTVVMTLAEKPKQADEEKPEAKKPDHSDEAEK